MRCSSSPSTYLLTYLLTYLHLQHLHVALGVRDQVLLVLGQVCREHALRCAKQVLEGCVAVEDGREVPRTLLARLGVRVRVGVRVSFGGRAQVRVGARARVRVRVRASRSARLLPGWRQG